MEAVITYAEYLASGSSADYETETAIEGEIIIVRYENGQSYYLQEYLQITNGGLLRIYEDRITLMNEPSMWKL